MTSLTSLISDGIITPTGESINLPIEMPNIEKRQSIYNIPLDYLYYNNNNGRISTSIDTNQHIPQPTNDKVNPEYNKIIENIFVNDNSTKLAETKRSIREKGQQVFGYVLDDGRVIDGNRRFTALRQLQRDDGKTRFFKAVILPLTYDGVGHQQMIKRLELMLQMGEESKVAYDPVSLAVDIYRTVSDGKLMTIADYANYAGMKQRDVGDNIAVVQWMRDFLSYIGADANNYTIIKDANLYTQINELAKNIGRQYAVGSPEYESTKRSAFAIVANLVRQGGDRGRDIRDYINNIVKTVQNDDFNNQIEDDVDDLQDKLEDSHIASARDLVSALSASDDELRSINEKYQQIANDNNRGKNVDTLISDVDKCHQTLRGIEKANGLAGNITWRDLSPSQIDNLRNSMREINNLSEKIFQIYDEHSQ